MLRNIFFFVCVFSTLSSAWGQELQVGIATTDVTPAVEDRIPLGGYGSIHRRTLPFWLSKKRPFLRSFKPALGVIDPIRAKAMFLKRPDKKLLFIGVDVIGMTKAMHEDIIARLASKGFSSEEVIISATHTHSGPGGLSNNFLWKMIAMDSYEKAFYERFINQIVATVDAAMAKAQPAELHTLSFDAVGLQNNRRGGTIEPQANLLMARSTTGEWLGGMVNFAVHGTSLGPLNRYFSSDAPGAIEHSLEELVNQTNGYVRTLLSDAKVIFINGAEGDVSPAKEYKDLGAEFAQQTSAHWNELAPLNAEWTIKQQEFELGKPKLTVRKCEDKKWVPKNFRINVGRWIAQTSVITQVHFGNLWFITWPGEPTTEVGRRIVAAVKATGGPQDVWVLGLSNDHMSYFTTEEEFEKGGYEACSNFFGAEGYRKVIDAHVGLSHAMLGTK